MAGLAWLCQHWKFSSLWPEVHASTVHRQGATSDNLRLLKDRQGLINYRILFRLLLDCFMIIRCHFEAPRTPVDPGFTYSPVDAQPPNIYILCIYIYIYLTDWQDYITSPSAHIGPDTISIVFSIFQRFSKLCCCVSVKPSNSKAKRQMASYCYLGALATLGFSVAFLEHRLAMTPFFAPRYFL